MNIAAVLLLVIAPLLGPPQTPSVPPDQLFARSAAAPDDVRFYVHIEHVDALRRQLEDLPIADWGGQFLAGGQFIKAWGHIANLAGVNHAGLLDMFVGESLTLMVRGEGEDLQWVLITPADHDQATTLFKKLNARVHQSPVHGVRMCILQEHRLVMAHTRDGLLVVCPQQEGQGLFYDVLRGPKVDRRGRPATLGASKAMEVARTLGRGQVGVYIRHSDPLGGWSVGTLDFQGTRIGIRHRARFGDDAFVRPVTDLEIDPSIIQNFKEHSLLTLLEPTDAGQSAFESFIEQMLGGPLLSPEIRKNMDDIRLFVLGDVEGRLQEHEADMLLPTGAMCLKVKDGDVAEKQLDEQMVELTRRLDRLSTRLDEMGQQAFLIQVPNRRQFIPGDPRRVDLDSFNDWIGNGMPLLNNVDLCWQTVESPNGTFVVIATHDEALEETRRALEREAPRTMKRARWANCGVANGGRLSRNAEGLAAQAPQLAEPGRIKEFETTMKLLSSLAFGIDNVVWKMARPCKNEMYLEVEIELAPPISSEDE